MALRPAQQQDAAPLAELARSYDLVEFGQSDYDISDVRRLLADPAGPGVVDEQDERLVGFGHVAASGGLESFVHPDIPQWRDRQAALLDWCLRRARELDHDRVMHWSGMSDDGAAVLLDKQGFVHERTSWKMRRAVSAELPEPIWPADVTLRAFDRDRDSAAVNDLAQRAFAGAFGSRPRTVEQWQHDVLGPDGDVLCVVSGDELIGFAVVVEREDEGFIPQLAVSPDHRGRGLARSLLLTSFARFAGRDLDTTLDVDGENDTAARLYRGVGMQVEQAFRRWERDVG